MQPVEPRQLRRIALVTERYVELQGLGAALFGALLLLGTLATVVGGVQYSYRMQPMMTALIFTNVFTLSLQASYKRTFGDVIATGYQKFLGMLPMMAFALGAIVDMDRRSGPSVGAIALASYAACVAIRDWPWRTHHLIAASAGLAGALVTAAVPAVADRWSVDPARTEAFMLAYVLIGVGMVVTGLCDHQLLARSLRVCEGASSHPGFGQRTVLKRGWLGVATALAAAIPLSLSDKWLPAFPSILMVGFMIAFMVSALVDALRALRDFPKGPIRPIEKGTVLDLHPAEPVVFTTIAIVAAVQFVLLRDQPPLLFGLAITVGTAALSMLATRRRRFYRVATITTIVALGAVAMLPPARGLLSLVCACGAATLLDALADAWKPSNVGLDHAHTI